MADTTLSSLWSFITNFFNQADGSIQKYLNLEEFIKVVVAATAAGGGVWGFLTYLQAHFAGVITDPTVASSFQALVTLIVEKNYVGLAVLLATFILEFIRRYNQGAQPPNVPLIKDVKVKPIIK